jgi:LysM repeat protein
VKIAVFFVLAIHGIGLLALLMQGCGHESTTAQKDNNGTTPPTVFESTNSNAVAFDQTNTSAPVEMTNTTPVVSTTPGATEYTVVAKDTFGKIAGKFHVPTKALMEANPGVDAAKLQIGQKIHIPPAPVASATTTPAAGAAPAATANGEQPYTVKSGDSLTKIAGEHGTTVKALRTANSLKTDRITVGQKLKIPAKTTAAVTTTAPEVVSTSQTTAH